MRSSVLSLLWLAGWIGTLVDAQTSPTLPPNPGHPACHICGEGLVVRNTDQILQFPGQPLVTCSDLEFAGLDGFIEPAVCPGMPGLIGASCDCGPPKNTPAPTPLATPMPTPAPTPVPGTGSGAFAHKSLVGYVAASVAVAVALIGN